MTKKIIRNFRGLNIILFGKVGKLFQES